MVHVKKKIFKKIKYTILVKVFFSITEEYVHAAWSYNKFLSQSNPFLLEAGHLLCVQSWDGV